MRRNLVLGLCLSRYYHSGWKNVACKGEAGVCFTCGASEALRGSHQGNLHLFQLKLQALVNQINAARLTTPFPGPESIFALKRVTLNAELFYFFFVLVNHH